jgi:hypothetical protein
MIERLSTNSTEKLEDTLDFEFLKERLEKSSPKAIEKIKMMMKDPATWMGIASLVAGSLGAYGGMAGQQEVKENIEELQSQGDGISAIYQSFKILGLLMVSNGVFYIAQSVKNMKIKLKAEEEEKDDEK